MARLSKTPVFFTGYPYDEGDEVEIEYCLKEPTWGRIKKSRVSPFPLLGLLAFSTLSALGLAFAVSGLRNGIKARELLGSGKLGKGKLVSKEETNVSIEGRSVYALTFRFRPEGSQRDFTTVTKTHLTEQLEDDEEEFLIYDPRFPSRAVMLDNLPAKALISPDGNITGGSLIGCLGVLVLPLLAVAATVILPIIFLLPD